MILFGCYEGIQILTNSMLNLSLFYGVNLVIYLVIFYATLDIIQLLIDSHERLFLFQVNTLNPNDVRMFEKINQEGQPEGLDNIETILMNYYPEDYND